MILFKVFRYIRTNLLFYLMIILQLAWGFSYMMISHNAELTGREQSKKWSERFREDEYLLLSIGMTSAIVDSSQKTFERFRQIEEKYQDEIPMYYKGLYAYTLFDENGVQSLEILVLSDKAMEKWIGEVAPSVYIDESSEKEIRSKINRIPGLQISETEFGIDDHSFPLERVAFRDELIDFGLNKQIEGHFPERYPLKETLVVPGEALELLQALSDKTGEGFLMSESIQIDLPSPDAYGLLREITEEFNRRLPEGTSVYPMSVMGSVQEEISVVRQQTRQYEVHARMVVVITSLATIGIMLTFLRRRKKDIAVSFMMGSTKTAQWIELLLEISIVIGTGVGLALLIALRGNHMGDTHLYDAMFHPQTVLLGMLGGLAIISIVALVLAAPLFKLESATIVSQER